MMLSDRLGLCGPVYSLLADGPEVFFLAGDIPNGARLFSRKDGPPLEFTRDANSYLDAISYRRFLRAVAHRCLTGSVILAGTIDSLFSNDPTFRAIRRGPDGRWTSENAPSYLRQEGEPYAHIIAWTADDRDCFASQATLTDGSGVIRIAQRSRLGIWSRGVDIPTHTSFVLPAPQKGTDILAVKTDATVISLIRLSDGATLAGITMPDDIFCMSYSPDLQILAVGMSSTLRIVQSGTGGTVADIPAIGTARPVKLAFSPDGTLLAVEYADGFAGHVRVFRTADWLDDPDFQYLTSFSRWGQADQATLCWSFNGRFLAQTTQWNALSLHDRENGWQKIYVIDDILMSSSSEHRITSVSFVPDFINNAGTPGEGAGPTDPVDTGPGDPVTPVDPDPVSELPFEDEPDAITLFDWYGKVWNAVGAAHVADVAEYGRMLELNGIDSYVESPQHADFNFGTGDFTLTIIFKQAADQLNNADLLASFGEQGSIVVQLDDSETPLARVVLTSSSGNTFALSGTLPVARENWHELIIVREGSLLSIYLNSEFDNGDHLPDVVFSTGLTGPVWIGGGSAPQSLPFKGLLDLVAIRRFAAPPFDDSNIES